jgi:pimeloyl-ACP methyl ester carboxylesterase
VLARLWYQALLAAPWLGETLIRRTGFVRRLITAGAVHAAWTDEDLRIFEESLRWPERARASVNLYRTFITREVWPVLGGRFNGRRLSVPTLLLHGMRDLAIDHRTLGQWRAHADEMRVELREDSGHFIAEELPDVVSQRALELFAEASGERALR